VNERPRWILAFEPMPGWGAPMEIRVRFLLKHALRSLGLRCVAVAGDVPPEAAAVPGGGEDGGCEKRPRSATSQAS
jgi:hypothetical protein